MQTIDHDELAGVHGGMEAAARWVMMHESNGSPTAGHLAHTRAHSSAYGAFQMIEANRRHYMGRDYQSSDFGKQRVSIAEAAICCDCNGSPNAIPQYASMSFSVFSA